MQGLSSRLCRFSIRSLLVCTTICAVASSWIAYERTRAAEGNAAFRALEDRGAFISYGVADGSSRSDLAKRILGDDLYRHMSSASLSNVAITDNDLVHLKALPGIAELSLGPGVSDKGMFHIRHLNRLVSLDLSDTMISSEGLRDLRSLPKLEELYLDRTHVDDEGLKHLREMRLRQLSLADTKVTDAGMAYVVDISSIEYLNVAGTKVSDLGLTQLAALHSLREINITQTKATKAGAESLKAALPKLVVVDRFRYGSED